MAEAELNRSTVTGTLYEVAVWEATRRILRNKKARKRMAEHCGVGVESLPDRPIFQESIPLTDPHTGKGLGTFNADVSITIPTADAPVRFVMLVQHHRYERNSHVPFWNKAAQLARLKLLAKPVPNVISVVLGENSWKPGNLAGFAELFDTHIEMFSGERNAARSEYTSGFRRLDTLAESEGLRRSIRTGADCEAFADRLTAESRSHSGLGSLLQDLEDAIEAALMAPQKNEPLWAAMQKRRQRMAPLVISAEKIPARAPESLFAAWQMKDELPELEKLSSDRAVVNIRRANESVTALHGQRLYGLGLVGGQIEDNEILRAVELQTGAHVIRLGYHAWRATRPPVATTADIDASVTNLLERGNFDKERFFRVARDRGQLKRGLAYVKAEAAGSASEALSAVVMKRSPAKLAKALYELSETPPNSVFVISPQWALRYFVNLVPTWTIQKLYGPETRGPMRTALAREGYSRDDADALLQRWKQRISASEVLLGNKREDLAILEAFFAVVQAQRELRNDDALLEAYWEGLRKAAMGSLRSLNPLESLGATLQSALGSPYIVEAAPPAVKTALQAGVDVCKQFKYAVINPETKAGVFLAGGKSSFQGSNSGYLPGIITYALTQRDAKGYRPTRLTPTIHRPFNVEIRGCIFLPVEVDETGTAILRQLGSPVVYPSRGNIESLAGLIKVALA